MSSILDNIARGHLAGFNGIPEGTLVQELIPDFTADRPWGEATLGREHHRARFVVGDSATGRRFRVWFDSDHRVLLVDFEYPGLTESPDEMLKGFGEPDAVLDSSDRAAYRESLQLIRELDFDVLVPWAATAGGRLHAVTDHKDAQRRIDALIDRIG